jgi:glycosyltransferase involved in cell wall biosynthesis/predicted O-methyltransferase YrrM
MSKIAIVIHRCHETIVGGSESLAWRYATMLRDNYEVDVLTTTALDLADWRNVLPEGTSKRDGINVKRFLVTVGRSAYWGSLYRRLLTTFNNKFTPGRRRSPENPGGLNWTVPLQEEFIKHQGPHSEPLMTFIRQHWTEYQCVIFFTYLYPTTYFGLQQMPPGRALFVPTLHDEPTAYLTAYKYSAQRARELLWLTKAEQRVGQKLWGDLPGRVVSMGIDVEPGKPLAPTTRYLLYCGRVDPNKGCNELFEYFIRFKRTFPTRLRLVITGKDDMKVPAHSDIEYRGFVSEEEKASLMAGATLYVMPSANESFSIVTLEAMAQRTPVLANGTSEVLLDHIRDSGAGRSYVDYETFAAALRDMLSDKATLSKMGAAGRDYVISTYQPEKIKAGLIAAVESTSNAESSVLSAEEFKRRLSSNIQSCPWQPHPVYSVFTQYDREYYLERQDYFIRKYRCFYAVSATISPASIIELGTSAGAAADAYLSASPQARFLGIDVFGEAVYPDGSSWNPLEISEKLFTERGFQHWQLLRADLRKMKRLPSQAELVVVDAAHDFPNAYADLKLALTANPSFIFIDDADDENDAKPAIERFLEKDLRNRVEYTCHVDYIGGGLVIKLRR